MRRPLSRPERGTSLVDAVVSLGVLVVTAGGLALSVLATQRATGAMQRRDLVRTQALLYVERLLAVPYGITTDPAPTSTELADLLDDDGTSPAGITLLGLRTPVGDSGWRFRVAGFEVPGTWEIEVNADLDGNGTVQGVRGRETPTDGSGASAGDGTTVTTLRSEGRPGLLRIEVFFDGVSVARTLRAAPVQGT